MPFPVKNLFKGLPDIFPGEERYLFPLSPRSQPSLLDLPMCFPELLPDLCHSPTTKPLAWLLREGIERGEEGNRGKGSRGIKREDRNLHP